MSELGLFLNSSHLSQPTEISAAEYTRQLIEFDETGKNSNEIIFNSITEWGLVNYIKVFNGTQLICESSFPGFYVLGNDIVRIPIGEISISPCQNAGSEIITTPAITFTVSDWVLSAGYYYLYLQHNLDSFNVIIAVYSDEGMVLPHNVKAYTQNTIRLTTTIIPEGRFNGWAVITVVH